MIKSYFKMAWRTLLKNKLSSIINISGLAVGLATGIIILLVIMNEVSYDHFNKNLSNIYLLMRNQKLYGTIYTGNETPGLLAASIRSEIPEIKYAARTCSGGNVLIRNSNKSIYLKSIFADSDFFNIMTFAVLKGNPVSALNDPLSIILTEESARKLFGNENPLGKIIVYNNIYNLKVAAVLKDIVKNSSTRFDMVLSFQLLESENAWLQKWDDSRIQTWVQVEPKVNNAKFNSELKKLFLQKQSDKNVELFAYPFAKLHLYYRFFNGKPVGGDIDSIIILSCIAFLVLLIACVNFINLATASSEHRAREVGVRKVMGARRKLIIFQFMGEALLLSFFALLLGLILAVMFVPLYMKLSGKFFTPDYSDWKLWTLLASLGLFTGIAAGSYPAFYLSRFQPVKVLKKLMIQEKGGITLRKVLVTCQFVVSILLLVSTIVMFRQIDFLQERPVGYNQDNLIIIPIRSDMGYKIDITKNELIRLASVKNITATSDNLIMFGETVHGLNWQGKTPEQDFEFIKTRVQYDWIKTTGLQLIRGRDFSPEYGTDSLSCLINETAAKKMKLQNPVGVKLGDCTIIGIVKDFAFNNPSAAIAPMIIYLSNTDLNYLLVRVANRKNQQQGVGEIERITKKINPNFPFEFRFINDVYQQNFHDPRSYAKLVNSFNVMAIFISCLGLFGLSTFLSERRKKEISIRKVLGAGVSNLWFLLSKDFLKPVLIAFIISVPLTSWLMQRVLESMDYHIKLSWWIFISAGLLTAFVAIATVSFNSIKAAIANPAKNLATE